MTIMSTTHHPTPILIDNRNWADYKAVICDEIWSSSVIGIDCETHDEARHEGLNRFRKIDDEGFAHNDKLVFDVNAIEITGFSIWCEGSDNCYYFNVGQLDAENRIRVDQLHDLLNSKRPGAIWVAHNAAFELMAFRQFFGINLDKIICTMQMAVSAYGPDNYDLGTFLTSPLPEETRAMLPRILKATMTYGGGRNMSPELSELFASLIGKQSEAKHSYNGFVDSISYGYGLKDMVKSFFNYKMVTYEEVLGNKPHMGCLTGEEVVRYGCDDAYWAVRVYRWLVDYMLTTNPSVVQTFFEQENPMVQAYADVWTTGMRIDFKAIGARRDLERKAFAEEIRKLRAALRSALPFPQAPNAGLLKYEKWYQNGKHEKYRARIVAFCQTRDDLDDFQTATLVSGSVPKSWAEDVGGKYGDVNFTHYMTMRTVLYDLLGLKLITLKGKVQSDAETRGKLLESTSSETALAAIKAVTEMAGIEQRMKLFIRPYELLTDPETSRLHPTLSCELATRRMATRNPNPMQLAKRGKATYIRGFFLGDEGHLILSLDWSAIELVTIGEFSGDPRFLEAYSTLPHQDLHAGAAAALLAVNIPDVTVEVFKALKFGGEGINPAVLVNLKGEPMTPSEAYKYWRTVLGKEANFGYWYSGALADKQTDMGWTDDQHWAAVEKYREHFAVAEKWRQDTINFLSTNGYVQLPDGHRRVRLEATAQWMSAFIDKWAHPSAHEGYNAFVRELARSIKTRANNQGVNALIQGTCATIAKRSVNRLVNEEFVKRRWGKSVVRFMVPIHDELVFSVHPDYVVEVRDVIASVMTDHSDIFKQTKLDVNPSLGVTFEPFDVNKAPYGQIELKEAPEIPGVIGADRKGKALTDDEVRAVVEYLKGGMRG